VNSAISNLIRTGKTHEIYSAIEMGAREGMISLTRALGELMKRGLIDHQELNDRQAGVHTPGSHKRRMSEFSGPPPAAA